MEYSLLTLLTLIWVGFLGARFEVGGGGDYHGVGPPPLLLCLKLVRTLLEIEIRYVSLHTYLLSENISFSTKAQLILLMSAQFLAKILALLKAIV